MIFCQITNLQQKRAYVWQLHWSFVRSHWPDWFRKRPQHYPVNNFMIYFFFNLDKQIYRFWSVFFKYLKDPNGRILQSLHIVFCKKSTIMRKFVDNIVANIGIMTLIINRRLNNIRSRFRSAFTYYGYKTADYIK